MSFLSRIVRLSIAAAMGAAMAMASSLSHSQSVAPRPLKLVVPFIPGTRIDHIARQIGPHLSKSLGRPVVVDNKPGALGSQGAAEVARAPPDGSTLLVTVNTLVIYRAMHSNPGFDALKDLEPIGLASLGPLVLVASKRSAIASARELIERARGKAGALSYGSPGIGTSQHLAMEMLQAQAHISMTHVPHRGNGAAVADLLSGNIDAMFLPIHVARQHLEAGNLRALAISSDQPDPQLPHVPPLRELNLGDLDVAMWFGLLAPRGTPKELIDRMSSELRTILALPETKAVFETQGMTPAYMTPEQFRALMARDATRWTTIVQKQKLKQD